MHEHDIRNDILERLNFPDLKVSPDRAGGFETENLKLQIVDFDDFLDLMLDAAGNKLSDIVAKQFGASMAVCQVGSYRSVVGEKLLNLLQVKMKSTEGQPSSTYDFVSYVMAVSNATLSEDGYAVIEDRKTETLFVFMSLGVDTGKKVKAISSLDDGSFSELFSISSGRDATAVTAWRFLAQQMNNPCQTKVVIVNTNETDILPAFRGKEDRVKRLFGKGGEELLDLAQRKA